MLERSPHANPPRHRAEEEPTPWWRALDRRRLHVAIGTTLLALPLLVLDNLPARADTGEAVETAGAAGSDAPTTSTLADLTTTSVIEVTTTSTTPTTARPTTAPPTTATTAPRRTTTTTPPTTAPRRTATTQAPVAPPTTAAQFQPVAPATTATTAPPAPPAPPAAGASTESGKATWYHWNPGECAHKTIPKGTVVTITRVSTGATTTCVVTDRGPYGAGRIIDLDATVFDDLATLGAGVIDVVITW